MFTRIKYACQRLTRGFDDYQASEFTFELANWILPRLKKFHELDSKYYVPMQALSSELLDEYHGLYNTEVTEEHREKRCKEIETIAKKEWALIIDKMIYAFDAIKNENFDGWEWESNDKILVFNEDHVCRVNEGLDLFRKYILHLWS